MNAFWEGVLAGYGIAIPVGAIAILLFGFWLERNALVWPSLVPDDGAAWFGPIQIGIALGFGMLVTNVPEFCLEEVSDHVMALLLACARGIVRHAFSSQLQPYRHISEALEVLGAMEAETATG